MKRAIALVIVLLMGIYSTDALAVRDGRIAVKNDIASIKEHKFDFISKSQLEESVNENTVMMMLQFAFDDNIASASLLKNIGYLIFVAEKNKEYEEQLEILRIELEEILKDAKTTGRISALMPSMTHFGNIGEGSIYEAYYRYSAGKLTLLSVLLSNMKATILFDDILEARAKIISAIVADSLILSLYIQIEDYDGALETAEEMYALLQNE